MANRPLRILVVLVLAIAAGFGGALAAQGTSASPDVLSALLTEVRGLRAAMEQMASAGPRIEVALGRVQLQEQRVNNVLRRHTEVRERLAATEREAENFLRQMESLQLALQTLSDDNERKEMQHQLAQIKGLHTQTGADLQRLRTEEVEAAQLIALEQGRWTEINQRLEELERALTRR
jgi:chromosome segregation ATPase